jgi:predicted dehydrogenase
VPKKGRRDERIRVGIVGVGIGAHHARGYSKCDGVEIVALCDLDTDRAQKVAEEYAVGKVFGDYQSMLAEAKPDAVSVCTPNALHAPVAIAALEAGCHVLCEKPLATNAKDGKRILDASRKAKGKFMIGMNNRFRGDTQLLKRFIEDGELGDIYYARCGWVRRNGIPGMGGWFTRKEMSGGGPLIDIGVHALDVTLYLMGNPKPVSVFGTTYAKFGPRGKGLGGWGVPVKGGTFDVEDLAAAQIRFADGATLALEASWAQHIGADRMYAEVYGDKAGASLDPLRVHTEKYGRPMDITPSFPNVNGHEAEIVHFVECIREDKQPLATAEQALDVMKILDGIYESSRTGASVQIK